MAWLFPEDDGRRRVRDRVLAVLFLLGAVVLVERAARKDAGVLEVNREFGARFLAGEDPYFDPRLAERVHGPYPPSYAIVCAPLSLLPLPVARRLWALAQVAALLVLYRLLRTRAREHWPGSAAHAPMVFALALLLTSRFVLRDTAAGGGNLLYASLAVLGIEGALRGRPLLAGLPLGLGLVLKPNLAPLLLFFALRGRWRTLASTALVAAILFTLPALSFGPAAYLELAQRWLAGVAAYATLTDLHASALVPEGFPVAHSAMNQSLREAVFRLVRPPGDSGAFDIHVLELPARGAILFAQLAGLALTVVVSVSARRARPGAGEWLAALGFLPLCLLLSPITWKAHHAALLPLCFALLMFARQPDRPRWLVPGAFVYYVLCNLSNVELLGDELGDRLQAFSLVTWGAVALALAAVALQSRVPRDGQPDLSRGDRPRTPSSAPAARAP